MDWGDQWVQDELLGVSRCSGRPRYTRLVDRHKETKLGEMCQSAGIVGHDLIHCWLGQDLAVEGVKMVHLYGT